MTILISTEKHHAHHLAFTNVDAALKWAKSNGFEISPTPPEDAPFLEKIRHERANLVLVRPLDKHYHPNVPYRIYLEESRLYA